MKVVVINNIYPPFDRGGAEQVVVQNVHGLVASGHDVIVITTTPGKAEWETKKVGDRSYQIYRIHPPNIFFYTNAHQHGALARALWHVLDVFNVWAAGSVKDILAAQKPDVVHTHNLMGLSFLVPKVIRRLDLRHIQTVHDVQLVEPSAMILKAREKTWRYTGWPTKMYTALMRHLFGSPHVVISPSQFLRDFYLSRGFSPKSKVEVLRNPLTFPELTSPKIIREPDGRFRFLYVGQIEAHKGVVELIKAFRQLTIEGAELHIVGGGSKLGLVEQLVDTDKRIKMYGRLDRRELPAIFSRMDMTVVPSLCYENSPTVIFESFAAGVPVLASDIEGIAELIRQGENGLTFPAGDVAGLKNKLEWCLQNQEKVKEMSGETGKSLAGLSLEEYITKLVGLYMA